MKKELELYIHIPFCVKKCRYCDFLSAPAEEAVQSAYVNALLAEIGEYEEPEDQEVVTVFFGGGTPSVLPGKEIGRILSALKEKFVFAEDTEISLEANPGTLDEEKLSCYREAGINRLSLGLQSAKREELQMLGRIHTYETFLESMNLARKAGFSNLNVDLMSALPGQTAASWEETLKKVISLHPEHISAYSLIIEEGTPFYEEYARDVKRRDLGEKPEFLPSEEEERFLYQRTQELLSEAGYERYEISNYAQKGKECRHNVGYWRRRNYVGFGLGAATLLNPVRYKNTDCLDDYLAGDFSKKEFLVLTKDNQIEETMFLGLRMREGVSKETFLKTFSCPLNVVYGRELEKLKKEGLIAETETHVFLTEKGVDVSNYVLSAFLFD